MSSSERKAKDAEPGNSHGMPPTLRPFLDQLPPPSTPRTSEEIPRPSVQNYQSDDRTPTKSFFTGRTLERSPSPNDNDEASEEDGDSSTLNDTGDDLEEFESHYSRRSSPASSEDEDIMSLPVQRVNTLDEAVSDTVQRVNSFPASGLLSMTSTSDVPQQFQLHASGSLHTSRSTTSLPYRAPPLPPPLYPPFYNRPPTPLPPSPSLTSLLRPPSLLNRSTTSTRPTTPDSSDVETPNDTEAAVAHSARRANPLPPTAPKVPTYEYYGFVLYLASSLAFLIYILWAYLPSPFLHALGITYYPNRWWALAIPGWIVMMLVYIYVALACWNVEYMTLGLDRVECIVDDAGSVAILDDNGRLRKGGSKKWVSEVEEKRRREGLMRSWGKDGGSARRRKGKEKARLKEERELEEMWYGYTGEVTENGVASGLSWRQIWNEGTDAVMDVPLGGVCEVLYGEGRDM